MKKGLYLTDCEGPISKNDNAFELAEHFVPEGGAFFAKLSRYDDYLADIEKKPGYKAGDTLKLIVPFLKAHGATDDAVRQFSSGGLVLVPRADEMLRAVAGLMPAYIISTSYRPYIEALCAAIGFPVSNTYCTEIELDSHVLPEGEVKLLRTLTEEIPALPKIDLPPDATSFDQLDEGSRRTIDRLNEVMWNKLAPLESGRMISSVDPVGGTEKARAVESAKARERCDWHDVIYVGDSITDREAMELVRSRGGTSVSFNGNRYALQFAQYAVVSQNASVCELLARVVRDHGTDGLKPLADGWQRRDYPPDIVPDEMRTDLERIIASDTLFARITADTLPELTTASEHARKSLRGTKIGSLG
jgi:predicted HAD superfamily phosphohydrolase